MTNRIHQAVEKVVFILFSRTRKGLGERRVPQLESAVGIHFRRGKAEISRLLADGMPHPERDGGSGADFAKQSA